MDNFEIVIASFPDKENLVAEIYYNNLYWVQLSKETEELLIKFYPHPTNKYWEFPVDKALEVLEKAKQYFLEMQVMKD